MFNYTISLLMNNMQELNMRMRSWIDEHIREVTYGKQQSILW